MPYCISCGGEVTKEMLFCPQCGGKLAIPKAGFEEVKTREHAVEAEEKEAESIPQRIERIRKGKLYRQWRAYSGLPAGQIRSTKTSKDIPVYGGRSRRNFALIYISLGVCIGILATVLVFLLVFFLTQWF